MKNKKIIFFIISSIILIILLNVILLKLYDSYIYNTLNNMVYSLENIDSNKELELIESLVGDSNAPNILNKYGIKESTMKNISSYKNFRIELIILITSAFLIIILLWLFIYYLHSRKIKKEIKIINEYLQDILNDKYELNIAEYNENELSVLKNDIYKVTIKLKELSSYEQKEQQFLMNTLEDISHQLKTPLTALMITNDILVNNDLTPTESKDFLSKETKELEKMEWLITTLLKLSKLDSGQVKLKKEKIKAENLIDMSLSSLLIPLELKQVTVIKKHLDLNLVCDISWMREALTNILKNASEHVLEKGCITITGDDNPVYKMIEITDNGPGISKHDIKNIFKRFYSTSSSKNSMGIGLNMARIIVEKHNGKIEVDSVVGKYTTFKIIFIKRNY